MLSSTLTRIATMQRGMWAMIACSIALAIWTGGLSFLHRRNEKRRIDGQSSLAIDNAKFAA